jgi:flagellar protein FliO/FliZ
MFDTLFGQGPYALKLLFFFIVVFGVLALALWLLRRFGGQRLTGGAVRGRQPRLAVIDEANVDSRRRLVLIRRDNVEHLLMLGGPSDLVIEPNIVRAPGTAREVAAPRPVPAPESLPRAVPLGESWPLQPEPMPRPEPLPRVEPPLRPQRAAPPQPSPSSTEEATAWSEPEPELPPAGPRERRPRPDLLTGLAEELGRAPAAGEGARVEPALRQPPRREGRARPPAPPPSASGPAPEPKFNSPQNLAEMAQRLEAALRRPKPEEIRPPAPAPASAQEATDEPAPPATAGSSAPRAPAPMEPAPSARGDARATRGEARPAPQKSLYDSLEQEMASLLGRPGAKT